MTKKNSSERGIATMEYGITIGAVALVAAALFAQTSAGITGVWRHATAATNASPAAAFQNVGSQGCLQSAHGNSKVCSTSY